MKFMNVVESRQQRKQRSISAVEAPWRFVRGPAKLLLRSLRSRCALYALVVIKALMNSTTTTLPLRSWRFICVSLLLLSWRLNYALLIICQHSKHFITRFSRFLQNAEADGQIYSQAWSWGFFPPIWTAREVCQLPLPRLQLTKLFLPPPPERRAEPQT